MDRNEVNTAFEILLEEIEYVANQLNEDGAGAFRSGDYQRARSAIEEATRLADLREKVKLLQREWVSLGSGQSLRRGGRRKGTVKGRLGRGLRTPEDAFRRPILEALAELGGSAPISEVLDRVAGKVKKQLNAYDLQALPSDPRSVRWRNTAQWCRMTLVREGLMKHDSPHGIWEISENGRALLKER